MFKCLRKRTFVVCQYHEVSIFWRNLLSSSSPSHLVRSSVYNLLARLSILFSIPFIINQSHANFFHSFAEQLTIVAVTFFSSCGDISNRTKKLLSKWQSNINSYTHTRSNHQVNHFSVLFLTYAEVHIHVYSQQVCVCVCVCAMLFNSSNKF